MTSGTECKEVCSSASVEIHDFKTPYKSKSSHVLELSFEEFAKT